MRAELRKFEDRFIRRRNQIERKGIRLIKTALKEQYEAFLDKVDQLPPSMLSGALNAISEQPIKKFFETFYPMSAELGIMTRKNMLQQKAYENDLWLSIFQRKMLHLVSEKDYAERIVTITNTTREKINQTLQEVLTEGELNGYGIDKIRTNLKDAIKANFRGNALQRAKVIAQTEMIGASNKASMFAADSTGLEYRKYWSTSHLPNIRPTHWACEQESIQRGGLKKEERFAANGMLQPGDPAGGAAECCNCRCTIIPDIV